VVVGSRPCFLLPSKSIDLWVADVLCESTTIDSSVAPDHSHSEQNEREKRRYPLHHHQSDSDLHHVVFRAVAAAVATMTKIGGVGLLLSASRSGAFRCTAIGTVMRSSWRWGRTARDVAPVKIQNVSVFLWNWTLF
jgi:hypothetical protein